MLVPTGHENLEGRRWPWITIGIIVLNVVVFGVTYSNLEADSVRASEVKLKTLLVAASHPHVQMSDDQRQLVESVKRSNPKLWERMEDPERRPEGNWDLEMRQYEQREASAEMAALDTQLKEIRSRSILEKYAYHPTKRDLSTYITSAFLHGGWFHIIFNMWFLWLAGSVIEDAWGRVLYPVFYAMGCFASLFAHTRAHPDSILAVIGASGAVAALMGAFLVRHFSTKINFLLIWFLGFIPRIYRFKSPAWLMLPLWLLAQLFWGSMEGENGGVAYWAHVGGFTIGVVVALGMKFSGLEKKMDAAIEKEIGWSSDPRVVEAGETLTRDPNGAIEKLQGVLAQQPDNIEALALISKAYSQAQRVEEYRATLATLAKLHVKQREFDLALENLDEFRQAGAGSAGVGGPLGVDGPTRVNGPVGVGGPVAVDGRVRGDATTSQNFPAAEWLALCRHLENVPNHERAAAEYEAYARAYSAEKMSVYALVAAARINLKNLNNRSEATRLYRAADASAVPHLDWDDAIKRGLRECTSEPVPA